MNCVRIGWGIVILLCCPSVSVFAAKEAGKKKADKNEAEKARQRFLKRFDTNRDGKVTKEESRMVLAKEARQREVKRKAEAGRKAFMKRFDANGDGKVTKEETKQVLAKEAERRAVKRKADAARQRFLIRFDGNKDGKVTQEEIKSQLAKEAARGASQRKPQATRGAAKSGGKASRQRVLKRFDANRDGKVAKDEIKAVLAKEAKQRAAKRAKKK